MATKSTGALATKPSFKVATTADELRAQRAQLNALINKGGAGAVEAKANAEKVRQALLAVNKTAATTTAQAPAVQQQQGYDQTITNANDTTNGLFNQIQQQGPFQPQTIGVGGNTGFNQFQYQGPQVQQFNPQDFQSAYDTASKSVLSEFDRNNQTAFDKEKADFEQRASQNGWGPGNSAYDAEKTRLEKSQADQRQGAENNASQAGFAAQNQAYNQASNTFGNNLGAQNQGFGQQLSGYGQNLQAQGQQYGQSASTYQMPYQNLSALNPYFAAQAQGNLQNNQNQFTAGQQTQQNAFANSQAEQQFKYQQYLQAHQKSGGGGGGTSLADQIALQNNGFFNSMALLGAQGGNGIGNQTGNAALSGAAAGFTQGITNGLLK